MSVALQLPLKCFWNCYSTFSLISSFSHWNWKFSSEYFHNKIHFLNEFNFKKYYIFLVVLFCLQNIEFYHFFLRFAQVLLFILEKRFSYSIFNVFRTYFILDVATSLFRLIFFISEWCILFHYIIEKMFQEK